MKFADRLKCTATGTSAATITLGGAVAGFRTLAQAISDGALAVGDTGVPFTIDDGAGNVETSLFTVTSTTVLTRTSVLSSTAGGTTAETFTGPLTVFSVMPASFASKLPTAEADAPGAPNFVFATSAPSNSDGRPNFTVHFQTAPVDGSIRMSLKVGGVYVPVGAATPGSGSAVPPTALTAAVQNAAPNKIVITMSKTLASVAVASSAFAIAGHTVLAVVVSDKVVTLTTDPFVNGEVARTVTYTKPASNFITDTANNALASFSMDVANNVAVPTAPVRATALRNTSTGFKLADMVSGSNNVMGARSEHTARERLTAPQLLYCNWYATTNNEISGTGVMQFLGVSIEYPEGVFTPVKFGGATTYDLAAGLEIVSDPVTPLDIPEGAMYWVRQRVTWPTGKNLYVGAGITTGRTQFQAGTSLAAVPDYVMGGGNWSVVAVGNNNSFSPVAVLQDSTRVSIGIYGSSTPTGTGDTGAVAGALANSGGYISRAFAPKFAISNIALAGDNIEGFLSHCAKRVALSKYFTDVIISNGMNDIYVTNRTAAATITRYNALIKLFTDLGKLVYTCLHQPRNGGAWTSDAAQVIDATKEGYRLELQAAIKAGLTGASGYIDAISASETNVAPESGYWISSPVSTTDGIHMNAPTHALAATLVDVSVVK
jgi:hypothetical protein